MQDGIAINDPYESQNRRIHAFNKSLDRKVLAPMSNLRGSDGDEPVKPGQPRAMDLVINMGSNLSLPGKIVNSTLQGRPEPAIKNFFRFAVNTTLGLGGMFDPASSDFGLPETDTDFGETLAVWGIPEGAYLELPVLGPSTERDAVGKVVDLFLDPLRYGLDRDEWILSLGIRAGSKAGDRARFGDSVDGILQGSADSYSQLRLIYLMHRRHETGASGAEIDPYADDDDVIDPYAE